MIYGDEKVRTMARSILPATNRRSARQDAERIKRRNRRVTRQSLHDWKQHIDPLDYEGHIYDYGDAPACRQGGGWYEHDIKSLMWDRRDHDKLGPMMRWAVAYTDGLPDGEDRYMKMKAVLPDNLIGRHALSHLVRMDEFNREDEFSWYRTYYRPTPDDCFDESKLMDLIHFELARINRMVKAYNRSLLEKDAHRRIVPCAGIGDTEFIKRARSTYTTEGRIIREMIRPSD